MSAARRTTRVVDPAEHHVGLSATRMKSGEVHLHLTRFTVNPRYLTTDCLAVLRTSSWDHPTAMEMLAYALTAAARVLTPMGAEQPLEGQLTLDLD